MKELEILAAGAAVLALGGCMMGEVGGPGASAY